MLCAAGLDSGRFSLPVAVILSEQTRKGDIFYVRNYELG